MSKNFAGLKRVGYSDTSGGTITWIAGKVIVDGTENTPENIGTVTTNSTTFGGQEASPVFRFVDSSDFETVKGFRNNGTLKFWHAEFFDGRAKVTQEALEPFNVREDFNPNARDGAIGWILGFNHVHTDDVWQNVPA